MNKIIRAFELLAIILLFNVDLNAQLDKFYIGAQLGGSIPFINEPLGKTVLQNINATDPFITQHFQTLGKGINGGLHIGYMFNEFFGAELKGYYFYSPEWLLQDTIRTDDVGMESYYRTYTEAWHIRLAPSLVFNAGTGKLRPYAKAGLMFPVAGAAFGRRESNNVGIIVPAFDYLSSFFTAELEDKEVILDLNAKFQGRFSMGFEASMGAVYSLNENIDLFGEICFSFLRIRQKKAEVEKANLILSNGEVVDVRPVLSLAGVYQYTEFVDELDMAAKTEAINNSDDYVFLVPIAGEDPIDLNTLLPFIGADPIKNYGNSPDNPNKILSRDGAYSSVGINIGLKYFLGARSTDKDNARVFHDRF